MVSDEGGGRDRKGLYEEFARREEALMKRFAEGRESKISSLTRDLVLETIDQVQRRIEADPEPPDRNRRD